jgi:hypothetical protein
MAFSRDGLTRLGGANSDAGAMWLYYTADAYTLVDDADYFLSAINEMKKNDAVIVVSATGGTAVCRLTYVAANTGTSITLAAGVVATA